MTNNSNKEGLKSTLSKLRQKFSQLSVTVEPVLLLHNMATQLVFLSSLDLMEQKACLVNLEYPSFTCDQLSANEEEETKVQSLVSEFLMWRSILEASIKLISVPMLGWWADTTGSRSPLLLSLACLTLEASCFLVNSLVVSWPLGANLLGSFFYGISGGTQALLMLSFSYLANETTTNKRTQRMGILDGFYYLGSPIGLAIAPLIFKSLGYAGVFSMAILIYLIVLVYVFILLRGNSGIVQEESIESSVRNQSCRTIGIENLMEAFYTTFKKRPARKYIMVLILAMLLDSFVVWGESAVKYMFTQKALDWSYEDYSHYGTASSLLTSLGALILVPFLTKIRMQDAFIGLIGAASRSLERAVYVCASVFGINWFMYLGSFIGAASSLAPTAIRSLLSKLALEDVGQVYAVMAVGESLLPFVTAPIYTKLYTKTLNGFCASFYVLSIGINVLLAIDFLYVQISMKIKARLDENN